MSKDKSVYEENNNIFQSLFQYFYTLFRFRWQTTVTFKNYFLIKQYRRLSLLVNLFCQPVCINNKLLKVIQKL